MDAKSQGAIEALAWVIDLLHHQSMRRSIHEIELVRDEILHGVSVEFRERIRAKS